MFQKHIREFVPFPGSPSANFSTFTNIRSRCLTFVRSVKKFLLVSARKPCFGFTGTYFFRQLSLLVLPFKAFTSYRIPLCTIILIPPAPCSPL